MRIYVGKLPKSIKKEKLIILFSEYGEVKKVIVYFEKNNNNWEAFAFIDMPNEKEAYAAITKLDNKVIFDNKLSVHQARYLDYDEVRKSENKGIRYSDFTDTKK
ncbi:MAG: RNA-binding protein [Candidatus Tenebribacter burtonii]|jgi:RNA recognition motif-containing protein|nr:RNA-binding protein [Candidatus Tenebribacter burtonii]